MRSSALGKWQVDVRRGQDHLPSHLPFHFLASSSFHASLLFLPQWLSRCIGTPEAVLNRCPGPQDPLPFNKVCMVYVQSFWNNPVYIFSQFFTPANHGSLMDNIKMTYFWLRMIPIFQLCLMYLEFSLSPVSEGRNRLVIVFSQSCTGKHTSDWRQRSPATNGVTLNHFLTH